ncbi:YbaB/EbfC family nucleoid-associated protein [Klenkia terrae]|uniref:YbaB/EbfC family nucleoid-associated protein n=1 Tax=Klenkia terrae TaxID=1052259 RepID=A0ABU8ECK1_9ACTN|nr:YbaB/EbfC family nucleoid-associated protein [Klenkia terrae]
MPVGPDLDAFREYSAGLQVKLHHLMDQGPELARQARAVQVTETSPDGLVSVTVGARGDLVRLDLDPRIYRRPDSRTLADTITETVHRATAAAQEQVVQTFAGVADADQLRATISGDDDALTEIVTDQMHGRR